MITVFTIAHQRADLIELQLQSFQKNIKEGFEFVVINNDAFDINKTNYNSIHNMCKKLGLICFDIKKDQDLLDKYASYETCPILQPNNTYTNVNIAVAYALCYSWKHIISKINGKISIIDSDMFITKPVVLSSYLDRYDLCFVAQSRHNEVNAKMCEYIWSPGFILANLDVLPELETLDFWCGRIKNIPVDTGGHTHYYLEKYPELKVMHIRNQHIEDVNNVNFHPANYEILHLEHNDCILHYRSATNWDHKSQEYHNKKTSWLKTQI